MAQESERITLAQAAQRLGRSYRAVLDAVLRGELNGTQAENGRWSVQEAGVTRLELKQAAVRALEDEYQTTP